MHGSIEIPCDLQELSKDSVRKKEDAEERGGRSKRVLFKRIAPRVLDYGFAIFVALASASPDSVARSYGLAERKPSRRKGTKGARPRGSLDEKLSLVQSRRWPRF